MAINRRGKEDSNEATVVDDHDVTGCAIDVNGEHGCLLAYSRGDLDHDELWLLTSHYADVTWGAPEALTDGKSLDREPCITVTRWGVMDRLCAFGKWQSQNDLYLRRPLEAAPVHKGK